jgi:putative membrane protein
MAQELNCWNNEKQSIMKKICTFFLASTMVIGFFSCGNGGQSSTQAAEDSNKSKMDSSHDSGMARVIPATVSKADQDFAVNTANANMTEIQAGQMAEQKGVDKSVKDYGKMMVRDHTDAGEKLKAIADRKNITLPTTINGDMQKSLDDLQAKGGKDFDKAYLKMMVSDHKKVISSFEDEGKNGSDADIRGFADSTLHTLRHHLDEAQKCEKMVNKM